MYIYVSIYSNKRSQEFSQDKLFSTSQNISKFKSKVTNECDEKPKNI